MIVDITTIFLSKPFCLSENNQGSFEVARMPNSITLTRFVNIDVKSAAECYNVPRRSSARNNLKASRCFHMGQDIFAVATDVLEAFAARTRMSILLYNDLRFKE